MPCETETPQLHLTPQGQPTEPDQGCIAKVAHTSTSTPRTRSQIITKLDPRGTNEAHYNPDNGYKNLLY